MSFNRSFMTFVNKIPFFGKWFYPFPIKVRLWQVFGEGYALPIGVDQARAIVEQGYQFCFLKSNPDLIFDLPSYKDFNPDGSLDVVRVGRGNFKPVRFTANSAVMAAYKEGEEKKWQGVIPVKISVVSSDGADINKILAVAHNIDLARNLHVAQSKSNYDRYSKKPDWIVQLAPYITILITGLALGILWYLATMNPSKVVVSVAQATVTPNPPIH